MSEQTADMGVEKAYSTLGKRPQKMITIQLPNIALLISSPAPMLNSEDEWTAVAYVSKNKEQYSKYVDAKAEEYASAIDSLDAGQKESILEVQSYAGELLAATGCAVLPEQEQRITDLGYTPVELPVYDKLPGLPKGSLPKTVQLVDEKTPSKMKFTDAAGKFVKKVITSFGRQQKQAYSEPPPDMYS